MITPQIKVNNLANEIKLQTDLYLKHEDMHPLGSHKGRSIPPMINKYVAQGVEHFVISSSGNAALAAALHIKELNRLKHFANYTLTIYVGEKIDEEKLRAIRTLCHSEEVQRPKNPLNSDVKRSFAYAQDDSIRLFKVANPKQQAILLEKNTDAKYLRQSTDDSALVGYESLAKELSEIQNLSAVFIPTSSGTTAEGLYKGFQKLGINPQIHIIQTTTCHPIVDVILSGTPNPCHSGENRNLISITGKIPAEFTPLKNGAGMTAKRDPSVALHDTQDNSIATAIVDKVAHRKNTVAEVIKNSQGQGWIATNEEIKNAQNILMKTEGVIASPTSALSLVGLTKALKSGVKFDGPVVCILTGN